MSLADSLHAPIAPPPPGWWPPAPGWWLLALLVLLLAGALWLRLWRRLEQPPRPAASNEPAAPAALDPQRQTALDELASLRRPYDGAPAGPWLQALNALLKRLCRSRYPEAASHRLSGRAWLMFLDNRCMAAGLTRWMVLVEGTYRADCRMDDKAIDGLYQAVEIWIRRHA